jgi:hypothetical protein
MTEVIFPSSSSSFIFLTDFQELLLTPYCFFFLKKRVPSFLCVGITWSVRGLTIWATKSQKDQKHIIACGQVFQFKMEDFLEVTSYVKEKRKQDEIEQFFFKSLERLQPRILRSNDPSENPPIKNTNIGDAEEFRRAVEKERERDREEEKKRKREEQETNQRKKKRKNGKAKTKKH